MQQNVNSEFEYLIYQLIQQHVSAEVSQWLEEKVAAIKSEANATNLNTAFAMMPRKTGKRVIVADETTGKQIEAFIPGFSINSWTIDRLCRLYILMQVNAADKVSYCTKIENLFFAAEMNELVALYSSLIVLHYPEEWRNRCAEGIRSNIGDVLEAIMYHNLYAAKYLNEQQWNQLVLKAFFTEKDISQIIGIDERANEALASTLNDYANERWSAGRTVNPQLWRLVSKYIGPGNIHLFRRLFEQETTIDKKAVALACYNSQYIEAQQLLEQEPELKRAVENGTLTWNKL